MFAVQTRQKTLKFTELVHFRYDSPKVQPKPKIRTVQIEAERTVLLWLTCLIWEHFSSSCVLFMGYQAAISVGSSKIKVECKDFSFKMKLKQEDKT